MSLFTVLLCLHVLVPIGPLASLVSQLVTNVCNTRLLFDVVQRPVGSCKGLHVFEMSSAAYATSYSLQTYVDSLGHDTEDKLDSAQQALVLASAIYAEGIKNLAARCKPMIFNCAVELPRSRQNHNDHRRNRPSRHDPHQ